MLLDKHRLLEEGTGRALGVLADCSPMSSLVEISPYFPRVLWDSWFSDHSTNLPRLHLYDVYENELSEIGANPHRYTPAFDDFLRNTKGERMLVSAGTQALLDQAEATLVSLEETVAETLLSIQRQLQERPQPDEHPPFSPSPRISNDIQIPYQRLLDLRRYLIFLRFRNSSGYSTLIRMLYKTDPTAPSTSTIYDTYSAFEPFLLRTKRNYLLSKLIDFLEGNDAPRFATPFGADSNRSSGKQFVDLVNDILHLYCWRVADAEICLGIAQGEQEFILPPCCFGGLDEGFDEDRENCDFFFPISPTVSIYLLGSSEFDDPPPEDPSEMVSISIGPESAVDVHLRNSMVLHTYPPTLIFSSLRSIALSVTSYYEFRWINERQDYTRLRMRCRQKFMLEGVVKTLVIRDSVDLEAGDTESTEDTGGNNPSGPVRRDSRGREEVRVFDLTEMVTLKGDWAVAFGTFSDVWEGSWRDPIEKRDRPVAVKFLRQAMVKNVKERLIRRIQAEVVTWHRLCHRNVSQFFGIVQTPSSIGMVSPWYSNGIIPDYVKAHPEVDRLKLLVQVASGIMHLHSFSPSIVHGDLKGGNILIDIHGEAIITDFGLSKVMEETFNRPCADDVEDACNGRGTSVFAGSTRWMAPELIMALVEETDEEGHPTTTPMSDVYAFGSVCLEIASDELPYPHRRTDHAVTLDIIRGIPPRCSEKCLVKVLDENRFWELLELCWSLDVERRPTMDEALQWLIGLQMERGSLYNRRCGMT